MGTSFRKRWLIVTSISAVLIVAAAIFAGKQFGASQQATLDQARADATAQSVYALKASSVASCHRGNEQRIAINKSTAGTYQAFYLNGSLELAASKVGKDKKRKALEAASAKSILHAADSLQYLPLTDCKAALEHPKTYKLAEPYSYATYLKHKH